MQLPLLLAGPILRRVEPTLVSVWVALSEPATVKLTLWEGRVTSGSDQAFITSDPPGTETLRFGARLHIALVLLEIPKTSPRALLPGRTYSYDLEFTTVSGKKTLATLGLLKTGEAEGRRVEALGFEDNRLPSFALPPAEITDLRVIFGSCRRPVNAHMDAMPWIDDLMCGGTSPADENAAYSFIDPLKRPHQLFLGGDQIYADDVSLVHLHMLIDLGKELIGTKGDGEAIEHLKIDHVRKKKVAEPRTFTDYDGVPESGGPDDLPADHGYFPSGRRFLLTTVEAQMTTTDGVSHLFSFGEFAAMYLSVWSNAVWPPEHEAPTPDDKILEPVWKDRIATYIDPPLIAEETRGEKGDGSPFRNYEASDETAKDPAAAGKRLEGHRTLIREFVRGLAKVRRVLANIPTYMIFDDHDVTDDWFLNPTWNARVLTTSLGVQIIRNGLVSYALFQDWGNDPLKYKNPLGDNRKLLLQIEKMFPANATSAPSTTVADVIDDLLGLKLRAPMDIDGSFPETRPPIKWHFAVPGPKHLAIGLDNRTRRSFVSANGPPGNVSISAQADQIPAGPLPDGKEVLLVIAPLQVLGAPLLDSLIAPAAYRAFDMIAYTPHEAKEGLKHGSRGMPGTDPDAIEGWAFAEETFEAFLARLEPYRRVVLLSGDVHHSESNAMSYWKKGARDPARIVQFTSSGLKNVMPPYLTLISHSLAFAQSMIRAGIGAERLGWTSKPSNPVVLPSGKTENDIPRALRAKRNATPTLLPTYGWPEGSTINTAQPPDWSWRVDPILDLRADQDRPEAARPLALDEDAIRRKLADKNAAGAVDAYQAMAARHQHAMETLVNSRQILFRSNFGLVRFERRATVLFAIHEMYTTFRAPGQTGTAPLEPQAFVLHEAALTVSGAERPEEKLKPLKSDVPA